MSDSKTLINSISLLINQVLFVNFKTLKGVRDYGV